MTDRSAVWEGVEVEGKQFRGLWSLFVRDPTVVSLLPVKDRWDHIWFCFEALERHWDQSLQLMHRHTNVSVEVPLERVAVVADLPEHVRVVVVVSALPRRVSAVRIDYAAYTNCTVELADGVQVEPSHYNGDQDIDLLPSA